MNGEKTNIKKTLFLGEKENFKHVFENSLHTSLITNCSNLFETLNEVVLFKTFGPKRIQAQNQNRNNFFASKEMLNFHTNSYFKRAEKGYR